MKKETMELLEQRIAEGLENMDDHDYDSKERQAITNETCKLIDQMVKLEHEKAEEVDGEVRRSIDMQKLKENICVEREKIEAEKQKSFLTKGKTILEIAKVAIPVVIPMLAYGFYQSRVLEFEETGRINSTAGRELHLPKFYK